MLKNPINKLFTVFFLSLFIFSSLTSYFSSNPLSFPLAPQQVEAAGNLCSVNGGATSGQIYAKVGGVRLDMAATFLANMTEYTGAYYDPSLDRIVFVGKTNTQAPQFDKDDLAVAIKSVFFDHTVPQVSIDNAPGDTNLTQPQIVNFYPSDALQDTKFGNVMVGADYKMKQYMIGRDPNGNTITSNVPSYRSMLARWAQYENGATFANWMGSRWWFSPQLVTLKKDDPSNSFVFDQVKMQVLTQPTTSNNDSAWNTAAQDFATDLTNNYDAYAQEVPLYVQLKQLAKIVAVVKWISDTGIVTDFNWAKNYQPAYDPTPRTTTRLNNSMTYNGTYYGITGGVSYSTPNTYNADDGTAVAIRTASQAIPTTQDTVHWTFTQNGSQYDSVAVSANVFRNLGAYAKEVTDASTPVSSNLSLNFQRSYSSYANNQQHGIGNGWDMIPTRIVNLMPGWTGGCGGGESHPWKLGLYTGDGGYNTYLYSCNDEYSPQGLTDHTRLFVSVDNSTFTERLKNQNTYTFDNTFRLLNEKDKNGNMVTYSYDGSGKLIGLTDQNSHQLTISYNAQNLISNLSDWTGRNTSYTYDANGNLISVVDPLGNTTNYSYDTGNFLISLTNKLGQTILSNTYNADGKVITQTDASANTTNFSYDDNARKITRADSNGRVNVISFDSNARILQDQDALGNKISSTYGSEFNPLTVTDKNNNTTSYTYDGSGNTTSITYPGGKVVSYAYDTKNNVTQISDQRYSNVNNGSPKVITNTYDTNGNLTQSNNASLVTKYTYDTKGNILTLTDPLNKVTTFTRDIFGNPLSVTDPLNNTSTYTYDNFGRLTQQTDANGKSQSFTYDANGNMLSKTDASGVTQYVYDAENRLKKLTQPNNAVTQYAYSPTGSLMSVVDAGNNATNYSYDNYKNLLSKQNALNNTTQYIYDQLSRKKQITTPLGAATKWEYDANGNITKRTDANNNITIYTYDNLNRLTKITYPNTTTVTYTYDDRGNPLSMSDPSGTTTYTYDVFDRLTSVTDQNNQKISYIYDNNNNITKITYPDGKAIVYQFDSNNRIQSVTDWNNSQVTYTYNKNGLLAGETLPNGITGAYTYDNSNRLSAIQYSEGQTQVDSYSYQRDSLGNVTQTSEVNNFPVPPQPGSLSASTSISTQAVNLTTNGTGDWAHWSGYDHKSTGGSQISNYSVIGSASSVSSYTGDPRILSWSDGTPTSNGSNGNGVIASGASNGFSLTIPASTTPRTLTLYIGEKKGSTGTLVLHLSDGSAQDITTNLNAQNSNAITDNTIVISYKAGSSNQNLSAKWTQSGKGNGVLLGGATLASGTPLPTPTPISGSTTFTYDSLNRLTGATYANNNQIYTYDAAGNRTKQTTNGVDNNYTYDKDNRLSNTSDSTFTYNLIGNLLGLTSSIKSANLTYNFENLLSQYTLTASGSGTHTYAYTYNGNGTRLSSVADGTTKVRYVNDLSSKLPRVLVEENSSNVIQNYNIYGIGLISQGGSSNSSRQYLLNDAIGNARIVTDTNGYKVASYDYDPFGNLIQSTSPTITKYTFKEEQLDQETGLYYMRARMYDPTTGRFISRDPIDGSILNPQAQNGYNFANGNPVNLSDPSGMQVAEVIDACVELWPAAVQGEQEIQGILFSEHALEQMEPIGFGGRGVPPSVVINAIQNGVQSAGNIAGRIVSTFENVVVVTDSALQTVITVIKTGH